MTTEEALFDPPAGTGDTVRDMLAALGQWKRQGQVVGAAQRRALLDQALACDLAKARRSPTNLTGATGGLVMMLREFGLLGETPPPADNPLAAFMAQVEAAANDSSQPG